MGGGLTLDDLLGGAPGTKTEKPKSTEESRPNGAVLQKRRTSELCEFIEVGPDEIRDAHVKAAVFPSEKPEFERMVKMVHKCSVSDLLRDYLIAEYEKAKREGKI